MKFHGNSDATKAPLRLIYFAALHPDNVSQLADLYFGFNNFVWLFVAFLALVEVARSENLETALEPCQSFLILLQVVLKGLPARYHKNTLKLIMEETSRFWKVRNISERVEKECLEILKFADFFCKTWIYFGTAMTFSFNLAPFFLGGLPYPCYVPGDHRLLIYAIQLYATTVMLITLVGIALTFVSICAETVVQFQLLEYEFKKFGLDENFKDQQEVQEDIQEETKFEKTCRETRNTKKYQELVDQHNFLLRYCDHLGKYGNEVFVLQVMMTTATMCTHLYITLQGHFSLANKIKCGVFFGSQMFDFALYCVAAELVSSASVRTGDAIYLSNWLDNHAPEIRKAIIMVLTRAQKQFNFVGHGLVTLNLRTFTQVFKTALSFYAYLKTMSAKGNKEIQ